MPITATDIDNILDQNPNIFNGLKEAAHKKFLEWYPDNVHVVQAFGNNAWQLKNKGNRDTYSAYAIREKLRWDSMVSEVGTDYKISNNMTPFVARLIMKLDPGLDGIFVTKESQP